MKKKNKKIKKCALGTSSVLPDTITSPVAGYAVDPNVLNKINKGWDFRYGAQGLLNDASALTDIFGAMNTKGDGAQKALGAAEGVASGLSKLGVSSATTAVPYVQAAKGIYDFGANAVNSAKTGVVDPLGGAMSGAATGAAIGTIIPGIGNVAGAIGGAAVGAITSSIGTPGMVDPMTGDIKGPNGLNGLLGTGHSKGYLQYRARNVKDGMYQQQISDQMAADYYTQPGVGRQTVMAAKGGTIPTTLAYLDDGELIRTPDGQISEIPEEGKPTDSNLLNVPVGTQVLSDKMKVPGTKKTFAETGKEIMKTRKYGKDRFAENSKKLNDMNNQAAYDALLATQEQIKSKRGMRKKESKKGVPEAQTGNSGLGVNWEELMRGFVPGQDYGAMPQPVNNGKLSAAQQINNIRNSQVNSLQTSNMIEHGLDRMNARARVIGTNGLPLPQTYPTSIDGYTYASPVNAPQTTVTTQQSAPVSVQPRVRGNQARVNVIESSSPQSPIVAMPDLNPSFNYDKSGLDPRSVKTVTSPVPQTYVDYRNDSPDNSFPFDWGDLANMAGAIRGSVKPDPVNTYTYEPTYGPTEYNIDPLIREANLTNSMNRYNASRVSPRTGASLALGIQSGNARNRAVADAYSQKNNVENQLAFQNAQIANTRNQYDAEARHRAADEYARNKGVADTTNDRRRNNMYNVFANMARDKKLGKKDKALLEYMREFFNYGSASDVVSKLYNSLG